MNLFAFSSLVLSLACYALALLIFISSRKKLHCYWGWFNLAVGTYGLGMFLAGMTQDYARAFFFWKIAYAGVACIGMFFYLVIYEFCNLTDKRTRDLVRAHGVIFSIFALATDWIVGSLRFVFDQFYLPVATLGWNIFFLPWIVIVLFSFFELNKGMRASRGVANTQGQYLFFSMLFGFLSGASTSIATWGVSIYPAWHFLVCIYAGISTYAIFRYRLMDISIAITRLGVFVAVYVVVLGIPILVGFKTMGHGPWLLPVTLMAVLATLGPFAFLYIQKQAEDRMLAEQRKYQATLRQASAGMGRIRDLKKLLNLIVFVLTRVVRIERVLIYFVDRDNAVAHLNALRRSSSSGNIPKALPLGHPLLAYFTGDFTPLAREDLQQRMAERKPDLVALDTAMEELNAELVFPIFIRANLAAVVVLGKKLNNRIYSEDDLLVFSILANQASLAIENALSYENMKKTQEQLFKAEKMATIGTMADGLSHQINNRLHALGFIASDILDTVKLRRPLFNTPELKAVADEVEHSLSRIQDNVTRGGEIVQGLMKYTRKGDEGVAACRIDDIVMTAREMAQFKIRSVEFKLVKAYDPAVAPCVRGNFTQLQEVFFNLIDNAYDATVQRKTEKKEDGFVPTLRISVKEAGDDVEIIFSDNGTGVNPRDSEKLFTPFFTTKATSKKGTGLGLYIIRKIIEENHGGKVEVRSVYGQGTDMVLRLAISRS